MYIVLSPFSMTFVTFSNQPHQNNGKVIVLTSYPLYGKPDLICTKSLSNVQHTATIAFTFLLYSLNTISLLHLLVGSAVAQNFLSEHLQLESRHLRLLTHVQNCACHNYTKKKQSSQANPVVHHQCAARVLVKHIRKYRIVGNFCECKLLRKRHYWLQKIFSRFLFLRQNPA